MCTDLSTNNHDVAVRAAPGINLSFVNAVLDDTTTFEYVCPRISTGLFAAITVSAVQGRQPFKRLYSKNNRLF